MGDRKRKEGETRIGEGRGNRDSRTHVVTSTRTLRGQQIYQCPMRNSEFKFYFSSFLFSEVLWSPSAWNQMTFFVT